jgi:hypothetical protein
MYIIVVYTKQNVEFVLKHQNAFCKVDTVKEKKVTKIN